MLDYLRALVAMRVRSERGASAVEYGLLVAGVALACIFAFEALGLTLGAVFAHENSKLSSTP
jgi:pilus assembly protein Flp/PilA